MTVLAPPAIPLDKIEVWGTLTGAQEKTITVSFVVVDPDDAVQLVTADLSAIGGLAAQAMALDTNPDRAAQGYYTATVTLTPPLSGDRVLHLHATDNDGLTTTADWTVSVVNNPPTLGIPSFQGPLGAGQNCLVTVACTPADIDGTIAGVTADLTNIGGGVQSLSQGLNGTWSWTGTVHPATADVETVGLTVTDNIGASVSGTFLETVLRGPEASNPDITSVELDRGQSVRRPLPSAARPSARIPPSRWCLPTSRGWEAPAPSRCSARAAIPSRGPVLYCPPPWATSW